MESEFNIRIARKMYQGCWELLRRRQASSSRYVHLRHLHKAFHGTCSDSHLLDNTNADPEVRSKWVQLAASHSVPIRCVLFTASPELCEHNDVVRALNSGVCDPFSQPILQLTSTNVIACIGVIWHVKFVVLIRVTDEP